MFNIHKSKNNVNHLFAYMGKMFFKVGVSILITFLVAVGCFTLLPTNVIKLLIHPIMKIFIVVGEILSIIMISKKVEKLELKNINLWFYGLSILNGLGLMYIFIIFRSEEIIFAAFSSAVFFLSMGAYGYFTKKDISTWGSILKATLNAIFIISLLQLLMFIITGYSSNFISFCISIVMVVILSLSTAFEMQNYKTFYLSNSSRIEKEGLITLGAMKLYLNYIIMFKHILRILYYTNNRNRK